MLYLLRKGLFKNLLKGRQSCLSVTRYNIVYKVMKNYMAQTILTSDRKHWDEWGIKLVDCITKLVHFKADLVALNAQYHVRWIQTFYQIPSTGKKVDTIQLEVSMKQWQLYAPIF